MQRDGERGLAEEVEIYAAQEPGLCAQGGQCALFFVSQDEPWDHHVVVIAQVGLRKLAKVVVDDTLVGFAWDDGPVEQVGIDDGRRIAEVSRRASARVDLPTPAAPRSTTTHHWPPIGRSLWRTRRAPHGPGPRPCAVKITG